MWQCKVLRSFNKSVFNVWWSFASVLDPFLKKRDQDLFSVDWVRTLWVLPLQGTMNSMLTVHMLVALFLFSFSSVTTFFPFFYFILKSQQKVSVLVILPVGS